MFSQMFSPSSQMFPYDHIEFPNSSDIIKSCNMYSTVFENFAFQNYVPMKNLNFNLKINVALNDYRIEM